MTTRVHRHIWIILGFIIFLGGGSAWGQATIVGFDVNGQTNYGTSPLTTTIVSANVSYTGLTRGSGVATGGSAASRAWGGSAWGATASAGISSNAFITFSVKANQSSSLTLSTLNPLDYRRSGSGPTNGLLQYKIDDSEYVSIVTLSFSSTSTSGAQAGPVSLSAIADLQNVPYTSTVTFRLVPYGATASNGVFYLYDRGNNTSSDVALVGSVNTATPVIIANPTSISALQYTESTGPASATATFFGGAFNNNAGNITVSSSSTAVSVLPTSVPYSESGVSPKSFTVTLAAGLPVGIYSSTLTFEGGGATATVPVTGTVTSNTAPALATTPTSLSGLFTVIGGPSPTQSYTINGINLTAPVTVSAPAGYEISLNGASYASTTTVSPVSGSVSQGVLVRLTGTSVGTFSGTLTNASTGLTATVPLTGTVNPPPALTVNSTGLTLSGTQGTPSATQSYLVSATALTSALVVTVPSGFEISSAGSSFSSSLTLASSTTSATITARLTGLTAGSFNGNITNISSSLTVTIPVTGSVSSTGEIVLTGGSYTQNFDGIGTQLPTGWSVRAGATATSLGSTQLLTVAPTAWNNTGGSFKNLASGDIGLTASTTDQNNATDRALGVRQSGNLGDPGAAFTAKLANTTGFQSFSLAFKLQSLDAGSGRVTTWRVDYGFGETPTSFTALTVSGPLTVGGSAVSNNTIGVDFGNALDNVNTPVWIRIVTITGSSGSGSRATTTIDDFSLTYSSVQPVLTATPASLTGANGLEYFAGSGPASRTVTVSGKFLTPGADNITVTTSDASNFAVSVNGTSFGATATLPYTGSALAATNVVLRLNDGIAVGDTYATTLTVSGGRCYTGDDPGKRYCIGGRHKSIACATGITNELYDDTRHTI